MPGCLKLDTKLVSECFGAVFGLVHTVLDDYFPLLYMLFLR